MTRLVVVWALWRLTRRVAAIALIAALGVLLLSGGGVTGHRGRGVPTRVERAARPLVRDLEQSLDKRVNR
jgi:hypothetical protein